MNPSIARVKAAVVAIAVYLKNLVAPESTDDIAAALRTYVERLERVRERALKRADEINQQIDALYDERDRLEAEAVKAWRDAQNLRSILED